MRVDRFGLIVHKDGGGDTACREGHAFTCLAILSKRHGILYPLEHLGVGKCDLKRTIDLLSPSPGVWRRHPVDWNAIDDFSRDQQTPLIIMFGYYKKKREIKDTLLQHLNRLGKYQNKDWATPEHFSFYFRALRWWWLWPWFFFSDLFMLLGTVINIVKSYDAEFTDDAINHTIALEQARDFYPTPVSWLARVLYYKFRQHSHGKIFYSHPVVGAIAWYFKNTGNEQMATLWGEIILGEK